VARDQPKEVPGAMSTQMGQLAADKVIERFGPAVRRDDRPGYEGYLVSPERLVEVATAMRDEAGYSLRSSVTGVDYLPEGKMEAVYHA